LAWKKVSRVSMKRSAAHRDSGTEMWSECGARLLACFWLALCARFEDAVPITASIAVCLGERAIEKEAEDAEVAQKGIGRAEDQMGRYKRQQPHCEAL
jgi:hypothetical protein